MLKSIGNFHDCKHLFPTGDQTKKNDLKKNKYKQLLRKHN